MKEKVDKSQCDPGFLPHEASKHFTGSCSLPSLVYFSNSCTPMTGKVPIDGVMDGTDVDAPLHREPWCREVWFSWSTRVRRYKRVRVFYDPCGRSLLPLFFCFFSLSCARFLLLLSVIFGLSLAEARLLVWDAPSRSEPGQTNYPHPRALLLPDGCCPDLTPCSSWFEFADYIM